MPETVRRQTRLYHTLLKEEAMLAKRVSLIILVAGAIILAAGAIPGSARMEPSGEPSPSLAPAWYRLGEEVQLSPEGNAERYQPAVVYNYRHGEYLVVWHNLWPGGTRDIYARRVSRSGKVLSWFSVTTGGNRLLPAVAYNSLNDEYLVVWMQEASPNVYDIWGKIIPWNGPGSNAEFLISTWANRSHWTPRVAWNSIHNEYLVIANAYNTTVGFPPGVPNDVGGHRVTAGGSVIAPGSPILISASDGPHQADLVYNVAMDEYLVVFVVVHSQATTGNDIYGLRVSWNGTPVNPPGLIPIYELAKDQNAPAVATNEQDRYMVVWEHKYGDTDHDIYAREYYADGSPVGSYFTLASWTEDTTAPDVAANGANREWLAVWQEALGGGSGQAVKGYRWGSGPGVYTYFFDVANYAFWENESPAVAADIPGYLIAYEGDSSVTYRHIYGRIWWPEAVFLPVVLRSVP